MGVSRSPARVLIADGGEPGLDELIGLLERTGDYECQCVRHPEEALVTYQENPVDIVISNMMMRASMTGFQLFQTLRRSQPSLQMIIVASHMGRDVQQLLREAGVKEVFVGPLAVQRIFQAVERLSNGQQRGRIYPYGRSVGGG